MQFDDQFARSSSSPAESNSAGRIETIAPSVISIHSAKRCLTELLDEQTTGRRVATLNPIQ
jgi:hypothetical protein